MAPTSPYDPYGGYPVAPVPMPAPAPVPAPSSYVPVQVIPKDQNQMIIFFFHFLLVWVCLLFSMVLGKFSLNMLL